MSYLMLPSPSTPCVSLSLYFFTYKTKQTQEEIERIYPYITSGFSGFLAFR